MNITATIKQANKIAAVINDTYGAEHSDMRLQLRNCLGTLENYADDCYGRESVKIGLVIKSIKKAL